MSEARQRDPIAIVGIGSRFPGGVSDPESFWKLVAEGLDSITEIPADRFDAEALYIEGAPKPGRISTRWGGFLEGIDRFDAAFFGLSPREAERLDPQQRLLLETSWEALEDAGQPADALLGSRTAVFVGLWIGDYEARLFADPDALDFHKTTGSGRYAASGRISFALGLQGPSVTVDTACSSSLVAVHLACQSIWSGESPLALAGGANVILQPHITIAYSQSGMMAADGRCKFGDLRADGYVRSEGAAMLLLKPLASALADGDRIYAVIRGSAVNNDGRSGDYMATPAQSGQEEMLRLAYRDAGISPGEVSYVEAHGTGTGAGDPVELGALGAVLAEGRAPDRPCFVGSVKANLGHTEGAAGVAGLIKAALVLRHRQVPPSVHLTELNPNIPWDALPLVIPRVATRLADDDSRAVAGVSAFGIAGTNAHLVLEQAPGGGEGMQPGAAPSEAVARAQLVTLSARSPEALRALAGLWIERLSRDPAPALVDIAYTASRRRAHLEHRLAEVASDGAVLVERLRAFENGESVPALAVGQQREPAPRIVFIFPGQGSQWVGMGRQLLETEPVFRAALEECEAAMRPLVDWSLLEQLALEAESPGYLLDRIDVVQPVLVSLDIALARLWESWGIEPAAVVGHSMGEVAAAHVSGALGLTDSMRVICERSRLLRRVSGRGAMAVIELPRAAAEAALLGYESRVSVAASNSPLSTILSGEVAGLEEILERLEQQGVFCRRVNVDVASHSPQVDPLRSDLLAALEGLDPRPAAVAFHSTVLDRPLKGDELDGAYWERNLRQPVLFMEAVQKLCNEGHTVFLEVSPHPVLLPAVQQTLQQAGDNGLALASLRREEPERGTLLQVLGELYVMGCPVAWDRVVPGGRFIPLPTYPWQRERYWLEPMPRAARPAGNGVHPLLAGPMRSATGHQVWEGEVSTGLQPFLADHRVRGQAVLPAAAYLEMALTAAAEFGPDRVLEDFTFDQAAFPAEEGTGPTLQVIVEPDSANAATVQVFSRAATAGEGVWTRNARGRIVVEAPAQPDGEDSNSLAPALTGGESRAVSGAEHYRAAAVRGLEYGPSFQGIEAYWPHDGGIAARLRLPEPARDGASGYRVHPALLDACLQLLLPTLQRQSDDESIYLPVAMRRLRLYRQSDPDAVFLGRAVRRGGQDEIEGDVLLLDADGRKVLSIEGLRLKRVQGDGSADVSQWVYAVEWHPRPLATATDALDGPGTWLLLADEGGVAAEVAARLEDRGESCVLANPADLDRRMAEVDAGGRRLRGVVHLGSLDPLPDGDVSSDDLEAVQEKGVVTLLELVQTLARRETGQPPRLWIVTRGAQQPQESAPFPAIAHATLWGMGSVLVHEHPALRPACIDLDPEADTTGASAATLCAELLGADAEDRVAYRGGERLVARLVRAPGLLADDFSDVGSTRIVASPYRVTTTGAGVLDNLRPRSAARLRPGSGEVEIEVRAVGLNFMNVMSALGMYPGYPDGVGPLGIECAGVITAVGEQVDAWREGDRVVAFAFDCLATHALADARLVAPVPSGFSFDDAATLPIAFLTAEYALSYLGRLGPGERVLIHAASGGVGLASIQLAKQTGAEIFATAGSEEKREYLRSMGIQHVFDSRSLAFVDQILAATGGEGVDVVLNSLSGEAIQKSLSLLRPYGRFLEIGKRDIHENTRVGLAPFRNHLSYFAIDLDRGARERPALLGGMLRELLARVETGELEALPKRVFPVPHVVDAFREMAQARHIGKLVVSIEEVVETAADAGVGLRQDATYLITGGLGGLGLAVARWMVEEGARHLVLLGRKGASESARAAVAELEAMGAEVLIERADVASEPEMASILDRIEAELPPLRGIIHAAGLLADATVTQMSRERLLAPLAAKLRGAWNLHRLTRTQPLDFFVLFSSAASVLGTPGQANYAAANAFLDALAHTRRAHGMPALSINWGTWSEIGLAAAEANRGARLVTQGLRSFRPGEAITALSRVLRSEAPQLAVMGLDVARWCSVHPAAAASPLLEALREAAPKPVANQSDGHAGRIRDAMLDAAPGTEREGLMEAHLRERVARVLRLAPDRVALNQPLKKQGLDSLMTLELRNRLEADLGMPVSATLIWNYPTVALLARHLAGELTAAVPVHDSPAQRAGQSMTPSPAVVPLDGMAREQLESLLDRELAAIDELLTGD